jgi:hypothetical protein
MDGWPCDSDVTWMALTLVMGFGYSYRAALGTGLDWPFALRQSALIQLVAAAFFAAGPFVVWLLRRTRLWLIASVVEFVAASLVALSYFLRSVGASEPSI